MTEIRETSSCRLKAREIMEIRKLAEDDLMSLAVLYTQFWGEESSLEKMRATFQRLKTNPNYIFSGNSTE